MVAESHSDISWQNIFIKRVPRTQFVQTVSYDLNTSMPERNRAISYKLKASASHAVRADSII
ncbi:MAG: hypothetical protein U0L20_07380, partial [Ruminococcus sp.]|nr:hypothetical protein [Ruminococcus sp.]